MGIFTYLSKFLLSKRLNNIFLFKKNATKDQVKILKLLLKFGEKTNYGSRFKFDKISNYQEFNKHVPVVSYEEFYPEIQKTLKGKSNNICPGSIKWFAKSSGTTNDKSKFIPVSDISLKDNHFKAGKDLLCSYLNNKKSSKLFDGRSLALGGSKQITPFDDNQMIFTGDISAILLKNLPLWASLSRTPPLEVALMPEWEEKLNLMAKITSKQNITSLSGVPTWTIVLIKEVLKYTGEKNILEVWPNLELFIHGAVSFKPYQDLFHDLIPSNKMNYLETYNASEGFFAFQDDLDKKEMLLLTDHGVFYEFEDVKSGEICDLSGVSLNVNYALIISTFSGLWRYRIGDTIKFVSLDPYRIFITGRTKHFINAFGEEVIVQNTDVALANTCKKTKSTFYNYSAAPVFITGRDRGAHEWIIEFISQPSDKQKFTDLLDEELQNINSDYAAKRYKDIAMKKPVIHFVKKGFFDSWLRSKKKLGGQNKVPRLSNSREYIDDMLSLII